MKLKAYKKPLFWGAIVVVAVLLVVVLSLMTASKEITLPESAYTNDEEMPYLYVYNVKEPTELIELQARTYSKEFKENGQVMGVEATGLGAIDERANHPEAGVVEGQHFKIACVIPGDSFTLREYDMHGKNSPSDPVEYEYGDAFTLKEGCIYEFHVTWNEENLEENEFYGNAYYFISTMK